MKQSRRLKVKERIRAQVSLRDGNASGKSYEGFRENAVLPRELHSTKYTVEKLSFRQMLQLTDLYINLYNYVINFLYIIITF